MAKTKIIRKDGKLQRWGDNYLIAPTLYSPAAPTPSYPTDSLVARYLFDNTLNDSYGSNNGWTDSGSPEWSYGTGLIDEDFKTNTTGTGGTDKTIWNTTNSRVYNITTNSSWSMSFWLKCTNASADYQNIITVSSGLLFGLGGNSYPGASSAGHPVMYMGGLNFNYSQDMRDSDWHHYVYVDNGTTLKLYLDNSEVVSISSPSFSSNTGIAIGAAWGDKGSWGFNGEADLFYFYSKALTTTEISQLYNSGAGV